MAKSVIVCVDEGRKRVLAIVAGILVARRIKAADELFESKATPRTESMIAAAVQWAERIMRKIDNVFPCS
jgi:bifunctional DNase/RNase